MNVQFSQENTFKIHGDLFKDSSISSYEKMVWAVVNYFEEDGVCNKSNREMAKFFGTSAAYMGHKISKLRSEGYIEDVFFDGRKRGINTTLPSLKDKKDLTY